jgi:hypothetical protein
MSTEFYADRSCGCREFPDALQKMGLVVHRQADHFLPNVGDTVWLAEVARRGWIALSFDRAILRTPKERDAHFGSAGRLILLTGANADAGEQVQNFINTYPLIALFLAMHPPPFIARVRRPNPTSGIAAGRPGAIEMMMTHAQWRQARSWARGRWVRPRMSRVATPLQRSVDSRSNRRVLAA